MDNIVCGIYAIKNTINQKHYIGKLVNIKNRWRAHLWELKNQRHYNEHLQNAWNKYGEDSFAFVVLEECDKDRLDEKEIEYIKTYQSDNPDYGYNQTAGGGGLLNIPNEIRKKMGKLILATYKANPDLVQRQREKAISMFQNEEFYKEYREYRSSEEFRKKERESHLGFVMKEETKRKILETLSKPVVCVETGEVFRNAKEASEWLPGNKNIAAVVTGKRKSAGGYHWKYA